MNCRTFSQNYRTRGKSHGTTPSSRVLTGTELRPILYAFRTRTLRVENRPFLVRQVRAGHAIESEVGACTDPGLFSVSLATAGQEIENEAGVCRQGLGSSPHLCFNSLCSCLCKLSSLRKKTCLLCYTSFLDFAPPPPPPLPYRHHNRPFTVLKCTR